MKQVVKRGRHELHGPVAEGDTIVVKDWEGWWRVSSQGRELLEVAQEEASTN